jgi:DNA-binding XRE family transcriptional regulator
MTANHFAAFRARMGWTKVQLAEALEIDRRTAARYEAGEAPIPRHVALACAALAQGLPPMGGES